MNQTIHIDTEWVKAEAYSLGFSACGVAPATSVSEENIHCYQQWIASKKHADMNYLENYAEKRFNPSLLMEGACSIVSVALNYYPAWQPDPNKQYEFAWYAYGKDYHDVMKARLKLLFEAICSHLPDKTVHGRIFCDTAPILERYWAWRCGLGWIGKNTQLIIPRAGSAFFLGELLLDKPFTTYDTPIKSRCGKCTRCLDACPTQALESPYRLNASHCLSYLTIENKEELPCGTAKTMGNCIYGCDRCQSVCPWNRMAQPTQIPEFQPSEAFQQLTHKQLENLTIEEYQHLFKGSAIKRAKYSGLMRNIKEVSK